MFQRSGNNEIKKDESHRADLITYLGRTRAMFIDKLDPDNDVHYNNEQIRNCYNEILSAVCQIPPHRREGYKFKVFHPYSKDDGMLAALELVEDSDYSKEGMYIPLDELPQYDTFFSHYCAIHPPGLFAKEGEEPPADDQPQSRIIFPESEPEVKALIRFSNGEVVFSSTSPEKVAQAVKHMLS